MNLKKPFNGAFMSFFKHNVNGGILLILAAILAVTIANSSLSDWYTTLWAYPVSLQLGNFNLFSHHGQALTLGTFVNDALMAIFFFHVGLEVKREVLVGELSTLRKAALPVVAAFGGMIVPVLIFLAIAPDAPLSRGAAIPMATDIAFSLGVLSLLGDRVPIGLKIFLTALAVADDIGGIIVIAVNYTSHLDWVCLGYAALLLALLVIANRKGISWITFYLIVGIAVWYLFLQSGVHSTIAGVLVALTIPARPKLEVRKYLGRIRHDMEMFEDASLSNRSIILNKYQISSLKNIESASNRVISPLQHIEDRLNGLVNYFVMPVFAFASAGVVFNGQPSDFLGTVTLAVACGLVLGKFLGIFSFTWIAVKLKLVDLPDESNWKSMAGIAVLGGIGFTVSLFISGLSYGADHVELLNQAKLGIFIGSIVSGLFGFLILSLVCPKNAPDE